MRWLSVGVLTLAVGLGCAAKSIDSQPPGGGSGGEGASGASSSGGSLGGLGGTLTMGKQSYARDCTPGSLACRQVDCPADSSPSTTSVSGVVYDPAGRVPLYNAVVYVVEPGTLQPLGQRAQCEECSAHFPKSALAVGRTDAQGRFTITDMPTGEKVPLVIQLGKWRHEIEIPYVEPCANTELPAGTARLPRNSTEGDLPRIAVTTGHSDALECLLKKIGVDEAEFTNDSGNGRVHLYSGYHAAKEMQQGGALIPLTPAEELWADSDKMLGYDMLLLACEGEDNLWNDPTSDDPPPDDALPRPVGMHLEVRKYADLGGRIFGSHWHHRWINSDGVTPDNPYPDVAKFAKSAGQVEAGGEPGEVTVTVDNTFPKGAAFEEWLLHVKASETVGQLPLFEAEHTVDSVVEGVAQRWIYGTDQADNREPDMVQYFSFTTPVGAQECGRMVFSDVHVSFGGDEWGEVPFPERCEVSPDGELSPQEKALAFMIFDLSSCIQKETDEPPMPVIVK